MSHEFGVDIDRVKKWPYSKILKHVRWLMKYFEMQTGGVQKEMSGLPAVPQVPRMPKIPKLSAGIAQKPTSHRFVFKKLGM